MRACEQFTADVDDHKKINARVLLLSYFYGYGAPLGGLRPPELRYNYIIKLLYFLASKKQIETTLITQFNFLLFPPS